MKCRNFSLRCLCGAFELLKSVIIGMKGVLECYRKLRGVVEVSLRCPKVSKNVLEQDASFP